jgi:5'-nucleotidase
MDPLCNIVATVGNHEFDKGQKAMFDLMYGTNNPPTNDWYPSPSYQGATYPYISANIINAKTEKPLFPPYTIKLVNNIPVAFIGAVLKNAADTMLPENAEGVQFLDEAEAINHYIPEIKSKGVKIIIVLIHEGGHQIPYEGETKANTKVEGDINEIVNRLDDDVDVVMAGHTHQFLNAFIPNHNGVNILVTEANSYSASFAEVTLQVDEKSHKVIKKSAQIITTYANQWPGTMPDEQIQKLVQLAENNVEPIINSYVGTLASPLSKKQNEHGESNLGNLIADAFRIMMETDIGLTNLHGIRDDMHAGTVTWGAVYSVQPFSNNMVAITLTGKEIYELFEEQWKGSSPNILQISGLTYTYDLQQPIGHRVVTINHLGQPLIKEKTYTIATTNYLASGGGTFSVMKKAKIIRIGDNDHDTVINYIKQLPQPFAVAIEGRMKNVSQ